MRRHFTPLPGTPRAYALNGDKVGATPRSIQSGRTYGRVQHRAIICMLAALLALMDWGWVAHTTLLGAPERSVSEATGSGARIRLACRGHGPATVVIIDSMAITALIDQPTRAELAGLIRLCLLIVFRTGGQTGDPNLASVLPTLLLDADAPAPYVIISEASVSPVLTWSSGASPLQAIGFVLIHPDPPPPTGLVIQADGSNRPLPVGDRDAVLLAILSLFWPPDEGELTESV